MRHSLPILLVLAASAGCGGGSAGAADPAAGAPAPAPAPSAPTAGPTPAPAPTPAPPSATAAPAGCFSRFEVTETVRALAADGAGGVWAVGLPGVILRSTAGAWTPNCLAEPVALSAVWTAGPADAWAVGAQAAYRWNGTAWSRVNLGVALNGTFVSVWGSAPDDVWLLAEDVAIHWDGAAFSTRTLADMRSLGFPFGAFREVAGTARNDVWIAADRGTLHWDGATWWGSLAAPEHELLQSIWAGAAEAWTVGLSLDGGGAAWRWDGSVWREEKWPGGVPLLENVRGAATGELYLATASDLLLRKASATRALGAPAPPAGAPLVVAANDVWLPDARGVARWDGAAWTRSLEVPR